MRGTTVYNTPPPRHNLCGGQGRRPLRRGLSQDQTTGRIPVDVDVELSWRFPAEMHASSTSPADNPLVPREHSRRTSLYAFSPTGESNY